MSIDQDEVFQIKSKFLSEIPHPKLILKAIVQTQQEVKFVDEIRNQKISIGNEELILFLKNYVQQLIQVKLEISNSLSIQELNFSLIQLYNLHWSLLLRLSSYISELDKFSDDNIKMSAPIDAYSLIKFLELNHINENQIKTYICSALTNKSPDVFDVLTIACLRSRKICENAGSI